MFILKSLYDLFTFIHDYALQELYDTAKIKQMLLELQMQWELKEISAEEYEQQEAALVKRLKEALEYHASDEEKY